MILMPTFLPPREHGARMVAVVGESFHQPALEAACKRRNGEAVSHECEATLVVEFDNEYDENAIRVEIKGRTVGHLCRADAVAYRPLLLDLYEAGFVGTCIARIMGHDTHDPACKTTNMGVFLDLADPEGCRATLGGDRATRPDALY